MGKRTTTTYARPRRRVTNISKDCRPHAPAKRTQGPSPAAIRRRKLENQHKRGPGNMYIPG